jgi:hypothetical protein
LMLEDGIDKASEKTGISKNLLENIMQNIWMWSKTSYSYGAKIGVHIV